MRRVLHIIAWMHARLGARPLFGTFGILQALDRAGAGYGTHKVTVCAGDRVLLDTRAAKHDPAVFPRPDRFDITRHGRAHLSFGHGARYLRSARIEPQAVFSQLRVRLSRDAARSPARAVSDAFRFGDWRSDQTAGGMVEPANQATAHRRSGHPKLVAPPSSTSGCALT